MDNWFRYYRQPKKYNSLIELWFDCVIELYRREEESNKKFSKIFKDLPELSEDTKYKWMLELNTNFGDINIVNELKTMSEIKRPKVSFIDKDTMMVVDKPSHAVVHLDLRTNELVAQSYDVEFNGEPKEVEIRIIE